MLHLLQLLLIIAVPAYGIDAVLDANLNLGESKTTRSRAVQSRSYAGDPALLSAQQTQSRRYQYPRPSEVAANASSNCNYEDQMRSTYNRLTGIDKKLIEIDTTNVERLNIIADQQIFLQSRIDNLEQHQMITSTKLDELKAELSAMCASHRRPSKEDESPAISLSTIPSSPSVQQKLDALATLLTSTAQSVQDLHHQLQANITRLAQTTKNLQRRLNGQPKLQRGQESHFGYPANTPALDSPKTTTNCLDGWIPSDNGIVKLQLTPASDPFYARCEQDGWLVVMNRVSDNLNFERDWLEYKSGFGNLAGEFFIGLEKLHALTASAVHELRVELEDHEGNVATAGYSLFGIGSEEELYALNLLGTFDNGTARDSLTYHAGSKFSTFDNDNDGCLECNCAALHKGGGWFNWCAESNLMGNYFSQNYESVPENQGMFWRGFRGNAYSLRRAKMLIRPVGLNE